jgi:hypothetical protein
MKALFVSVMLVFAAGAAQAATDDALSASLSKPVDKSMRLIVGETVWACSASQCQAMATATDSNSWLGCRALARKLGPMTAYGSLDAAALAKCNAGLAPK